MVAEAKYLLSNTCQQVLIFLSSRSCTVSLSYIFLAVDILTCDTKKSTGVTYNINDGSVQCKCASEPYLPLMLLVTPVLDKSLVSSIPAYNKHTQFYGNYVFMSSFCFCLLSAYFIFSLITKITVTIIVLVLIYV